MNNEKKGDSLEPEEIPSTDTGSKLETTTLPEAGPEDTSPAAPVAAETPQAAEAAEQSMGADGSPSLSTSEDIANAVVYLSESRHITGEVLHVDGGAHNGKW